jgi:uncharacterized membrane protein HdeD (DUF308 family)
MTMRLITNILAIGAATLAGVALMDGERYATVAFVIVAAVMGIVSRWFRPPGIDQG